MFHGGAFKTVVLDPIPGWIRNAYGVLAPSTAMHFDQGYAWDGVKQVPFSVLAQNVNSTGGYVTNAGGSLTWVPPNTLRIGSGTGLLIEETRQNKCTNYNANPTDLTNVTKFGDAAAVLSGVDDTAALAAQGLLVGNGKDYKLDNSAGSTVAYILTGGLTGNSNSHTATTFVRGTGTGRIGLLRTSSVAITFGTTYSRKERVIATPATNDQFYLSVDAGSVAYFILNQLEEGSFATSPIVVAGAAASRSSDVVTLTKNGIRRVVFTYGDNTTATVTGIDPATFYTIPTNQKGYKRIAGYAN